jgi:two-component system chemotaxis response regulator CheB
MSQAIRVLVVDDSLFTRHILSKHLEADPNITVVGEASNGVQALRLIPDLKPDVITLDVQMPQMGGLETLKHIMAEHPTPVIMVSALTQRGARMTIRCLMRGATDFVPKPDGTLELRNVMDDLIAKVKAAASIESPALQVAPTKPRPAQKAQPHPFHRGDPLVIIGASTGGPKSLREVLAGLPADLKAAIVVVQHMPPGFTTALAKRLDQSTALLVQEAAEGDKLMQGLALVAPSDYHLRFSRSHTVILDQEPRVKGVRPALDVTMKSAVEMYGDTVIGVILTGMGTDGEEGAHAIKTAGGRIIAEHESTSVIYGMPRSVIEAGLADHITPLPDVSSMVIRLVK